MCKTLMNSYRRAAARTESFQNCPSSTSSRRPHASVPPAIRVNNGSVAAADRQQNSQISENDVGVDKLKAEVRKLRRLVRKKDLVIDMLVERIVKLRRLHRVSEDSPTSGDDRLNTILNDSSSTQNATTLGVVEDYDISPGRRSSISSLSSDICPNHSRVCTGRSISFTTVVPPQTEVMSHTVVLRKEAKGGNNENSKQALSEQTRQLALFNMDKGAFEASNETFVIPMLASQQNDENQEKTEVRHLVVARSLSDREHVFRDPRLRLNLPINRDTFVIEGLSTRSEDNHPDWKPPLPPSLCLRVNRPEVIRRIEGRQAAITAASALRHLIAEEKMVAARSVVQGKCSYQCVRNSLSMDPTQIKAFPLADMARLTKRRLRATNAYKAEVSEERNRMDIAASKIIAHSFSESTRLAALGGRSASRR
ncbi:hypothetical protein Y032_0692g1583 [Ancylostoma ceylanicum]|uniref:Uncharacterized protein n=1 Tax=Ancylostoma ceylanicum TaxID=53326 RepID=A0A016WIH8_9BILA|nr:hypothetical protein Y032_0692g1583 [Ancylostoma ceylanicum]